MRIHRLMDTDWLFHYGDEPDSDFMGHDDRAWEEVTLPHDWAVRFPFDRRHSSGTGYLPGGIGWYRRHFTLGGEIRGQRVRLSFQGVYKNAKVWINSYYLGRHPYGYTSFSFDVTPFAREGENVVAVRVEHEQEADSRWYTGSGIDRHVCLEITDPVSFEENGVFARTVSLDAEGARVRVDYRAPGAERVRFSLLDVGREVCRACADGERGTAELTVPSPALWSPDSPRLYTLSGEALLGDAVTDRVELPFGVRVCRFDADHGFFLNGKGMKIRGVCVHHDAGCLGAAVPKAVWRQRLEKLKAMGCNALRASHNPPDPDLLDLCDEMGFLVMDEAFDEWEGTKNKWWQGHNVYPPKHYGYAEDFPEWHGRDLGSMVLRDRSHPCVILWSIGNEIDYPNDPYVTPLFHETLGNNDANKPLAERVYDARKPDASRLVTVARELVGIVHGLDDSRPVLSALSFPELSNRTGLADELDLSGYNYREQHYAKDHALYPGRVLLGSENSHDPAAWLAVRDSEYISAQFLWTGVDYLGECPGWPVRVSRSGALDLAGFEKPLYFLRQALWTDAPAARLAVAPAAREADPRLEGRVWQGAAGEPMRVTCYTNCPGAELFLNGESLGKQSVSDDCRASWTVPYADGVLTVRAGQVTDSLSTPARASRVTLGASRQELAADGMDVCRMEVLLTDGNGFPAADERVTVQVLGEAELLGIENGRPDDLTPYSAPYRSTLEGRAAVYLRAGRHAGQALVRVRAQSGPEARLTLTLRETDRAR